MTTSAAPREAYDAVVVGGGHNGLVAAAYLARAGLGVCVLERRPVLGGACVTEEVWPGRRVSRAAYVESLLQPKVVRELDLKAFGYAPLPVDPGFATVVDGEALFFHRSPSATSASLSRHSSLDAARYPEFQRMVQRVVHCLRPLVLRQPPRLGSLRSEDMATLVRAAANVARLPRPYRHELARALTGSVADWMEAWFESEAVRAVWASTGVIGAWAGPHEPGTAFNLLYHSIGGIDRVGGLWGHVRGGMGAISEAIAASARAAGCDVLVSAPVRSIDVTGERVCGVSLSDGREIRAPIVLSNAHPLTTVMDLVGVRHFPDEAVAELKRLRTRGGSVKINCTLSEPPRFEGMNAAEQATLLRTGVSLCRSVDHLERAWRDALDGKPADEPHVEMQVPSAVDSTLTDDGSIVMNLFAQFGPPQAEAWGGDARETFGERCLQEVARVAPNVPASVIDLEVLAPPDLEEVLGLVGGSIFQGEPALDQLGILRPAPLLARYATPVRGLYLCGAGTHPGGGVTGAPGHNAAHRVLRDLRRRARPLGSRARGRRKSLP